jgi:hypothetical protein
MPSKAVTALSSFQNRYIFVGTNDPSLIAIDLDLLEIIDEKILEYNIRVDSIAIFNNQLIARFRENFLSMWSILEA